MKHVDVIERLQRIRQFYRDTIEDYTAVEVIDTAISALEKQEKDRWIPVTERLPEYGQVVMWCNENGSVFSSAITYKRGDDWAIGKRHRYKKVLAWRPLPEPYQEDKE